MANPADEALPPLLTERQIVDCIAEADCFGTVKLTYESGPYEITRTTVKSDKLARAIERKVRAALAAAPAAQQQSEPRSMPFLQCELIGGRPMVTVHQAQQYAKAYAAAPAAQAEPVLVVEKEPDYWSGGHFHEGTKSWVDPTKVWGLPIGTKLYAAPPKRAALTDEQWYDAVRNAEHYCPLDLSHLDKQRWKARYIRAAVGIGAQEEA